MSTIASQAPAGMSPEMESFKARLKATWMAGDYGHFAQYLEPGALEFLDRLRLTPGTRMLDVACGAGQIAIPAARAGIKVTGIDIATNLIEQARKRAAAEGIEASFEEGDAEALPYEDASFDIVVSLIGAMFAPRPDKVAAELVRVCRPGGRIVMANWTPEGHVGQMFKIIGRHVPPSPLMPSPMKWGDEAIVRDRLGVGTAQVSVEKFLYPMRYPFPPEQVVDFFFTYYGPTNRALAALAPDGQAALREELVQLWSASNRAQGNITEVQAEYLHVTAIRQ
ncbi:class I SAM-dependent methyltransferase [Noviherbaspirillum aerium]|uniref:class I SAM-dependent methyltransferase n=1 Tax=Noviherbaspirillum aerium TaxID=2588497 RepID=UPI001CEF977F|nr:class I SAM-dependent methyltransferase [Noviherbaspirillum aerium]